MSRVQDEVVLIQPAPFFGAVRKRNKYGKWFVLTALLVAFFIASFFASTEVFTVGAAEHTVSSMMFGLSSIGGFLWACYTMIVFSYSSDMFRSDALAGRDRWVRTELRDYLNQRYGTDITEAQASNLTRYPGARINRTHNGKVEQVRVHLQGLGSIMNSVGYHYVEENPVVSVEDLDLIIVEDPQKPRTYSFVQD